MATFHELTTEVFTVASVLKGLPTPNSTRLRAGCFRLDDTPCPHERGGFQYRVPRFQLGDIAGYVGLPSP